MTGWLTHSGDPYRVLRTAQRPATRIRVGGIELGGPAFAVIAGPCAVEGSDQVESTAALVREAGGHMLRGGVFKPRTSPYAFQGMGEPGLRILSEAGRRHGLPLVIEVMDIAQIPLEIGRAHV